MIHHRLASALIAAVLSATPAAQAGVSGYPGDAFDWLGFEAYQWKVDLTGATPPQTIVDIRVTNPAPFVVTVPTFQVFANCTEPGSITQADFGLQIDGLESPWTRIVPDQCLYHDLLDTDLLPGETRFSVTFQGASGDPVAFADVRFGAIIPAIPVPAPALLSVTALAALGWAARRRRHGTA